MRNLIVFLFGISLFAQNTPPPAATGGGGRGGGAAAATAPAAAGAGGLGQANPNDTVLKALDDVMWVQKLSDIADVDKIAYTSLGPVHVANKTGPGAGNPLIIRAYTFIP